MKCLYCTSETLPFAASGGLGEVAGSLPRALRRRLIGCRVVMPLYSDISEEFRKNMKFIGSMSVPVSWRLQYCGIFESRFGGVIYYFLDNEYYFKRKGLYGFYDDAERFSFFSRACIEMLKYVDFKPDIIHANDWQTALVPVYYNLFYENDYSLNGIKTVFTIHNIQYQGKYGIDILDEVVGISHNQVSLLEFDKCANFMKGAIETANVITTVSPSYALEIKDPWFSHGLDPILNERDWKIFGILNGIDTESYNPENDQYLYENYSADNIDLKLKNKLELQKSLNLEINPNVPIISMVTRMVKHKGLNLVKNVLDQLMIEENIQFVILGSGDYEYKIFFEEMQNKYFGRLASCFGFIPELSRKIYAGSDIFLMPSKSEPCGLSQMIALRYGTIPVVRETGGLKDTVSDSFNGEGNGFTFKNYDKYDMLNAIKRAICGYSNKDGWKILINRAMKCDNSWGNSANQYIKLYKNILK